MCTNLGQIRHYEVSVIAVTHSLVKKFKIGIQLRLWPMRIVSGSQEFLKQSTQAKAQQILWEVLQEEKR